MVQPKPFGAEVFLTPANRRAIGQGLDKSYPIDSASCFVDLLKRIDEALAEASRGEDAGSDGPAG
jgi:hypothetical protein